MSDYEATAYLSLEKLKEKHEEEIEALRKKISTEKRSRLKYSKDLIDMKKKVRLLVNMKQYDEAEELQN